MLRKTIIHATLILILMAGAASAQPTHTLGLPGYSNAVRSESDKKDDRELDRAYQSTIKEHPDALKNSDPWGDVRAAPPSMAKKRKQ